MTTTPRVRTDTTAAPRMYPTGPDQISPPDREVTPDMNDWPPPDVGVAASKGSATAPWSRRPLMRGLLVAWVAGGIVALVVLLATQM